VLSELAGVGGADASGEAAVYADWLELPAVELREKITADVREQVAAELNLTAADVEPKRPLVELGVDSLLTVALRVRLHYRYGIELPSTILWGHPTVAALSGHLAETLKARHASADERHEDEELQATAV
jgi:6-methylsalicylic acid synthase